MKDLTAVREAIRQHENAFQQLFCSSFEFSEVFIKNEDPAITLMYDHHQFIAKTPDISETDIAEAIRYQKEKDCTYIKIDSRFPLSKALIEKFKLEESITVTMVRMYTADQEKNCPRINSEVKIRDLQIDSIEEDLLAIDLKNNQAAYGEAFIRQFNAEFSKKVREDKRLHYLGAYLDDKICGFCYYFDDGKYKSMDGLIVNEESRHQYVASSLISYVINASDSVMYLHADKNDTPQEMYRKMGFEEIDVLYEYLCTEIKELEGKRDEN